MLRESVVDFAIQLAASFIFPDTAPLLEEKSYVDSCALGANGSDPLWCEWSRAGSALSAADDPVYTFKIDLPYVFNQGFDGQKPYARGAFS
jgi:hypothetical protein